MVTFARAPADATPHDTASSAHSGDAEHARCVAILAQRYRGNPVAVADHMAGLAIACARAHDIRLGTSADAAMRCCLLSPHIESVSTTLTMAVAAQLIVGGYGDGEHGLCAGDYWIDSEQRDAIMRSGVRAWLESRLGIDDGTDAAVVPPTGPVAPSAGDQRTPAQGDDLDAVVARAEAYGARVAAGTVDIAVMDQADDVVASVIALAGELRRIRRLWHREAEQQQVGAWRQGDDGKGVVLPLPDSAVGHAIVRGLMDMLDAVGAINYVSVGGFSAKAGGRIEAVVQRAGAMSPCDARDAAEAALGRAVALLREHGIAWDGPVAFVPSPRPDIERMPALGDDHPWLRIDIRRDPNVLCCHHCGAEQVLLQPATPTVLTACIDAFGTQHVGCCEGDADVVRAVTGGIARRQHTGEA